MTEQPHFGRIDNTTATELRFNPVPRHARTTGSAGWIGFAGVMMVMIGGFNVIEGLVAVFADDFYVATPDEVLLFDLNGWGWIHTAIGVLVAATGAALLTGAAWARVMTVILVTANAIGQLPFVGVYPLWSLVVIALCVVVIWAVVVHGGDTGADDL